MVVLSLLVRHGVVMVVVLVVVAVVVTWLWCRHCCRVTMVVTVSSFLPRHGVVVVLKGCSP
jgi:hypothetical protein